MLFGVYAASALASPLNLGHRHLLPLYPVLFILAGYAGRWIGSWRSRADKAMGSVVVLLLVLFAVDSWRIRPHYLSYFNALAGGPENGYKHLVDSSLDWGQDLPALAERLKAKNPADPVYVAYFGSAVPEYYGIEARWLHSYFQVDVPHPPLPLEAGTYCVSATLLRTLHTGRPGPWTEAYEAEYQELRSDMFRFWDRYFGEAAARREFLDEREPGEWTRLFGEYNRLRSVRLFHYLARRPPDAYAGFSILIFEVSEDELRQALSTIP